jgi:imidazolonepropionase-like amidohydrolase
MKTRKPSQWHNNTMHANKQNLYESQLMKRTLILLILCIFTTAAQAQIAVQGDTVYTMDGDPITDGVVIITDGKIAAVGPASAVTIPEDYKVKKAKVVTPGLIDARTVVGLSGQYNYDHDQDQLEHSEPMQPGLRAIDAYNGKERLVGWVRSFGVTTIHTGHAPGELISGQTMIVKTSGNSVEAAMIKPVAAIAATLGEAALKKEKGKSPGTRSKMVSMLRQQFAATQEYIREQDAAKTAEDDADKAKAPDRDLNKEMLASVLKREIPIVITAHRAHDIANAMRLAKEFNLRLILDGASESYLLIDQIKMAEIPVILHPTMMRAHGETANMSFETASKLINAGIPIALQSGYEAYVPKTRVVLFEAGYAMAHGLTFEQALATITTNAANILGISNRVGSITIGKDGDLALYDGDPFEYTTHCIGTIIEGIVVSNEIH